MVYTTADQLSILNSPQMVDRIRYSPHLWSRLMGNYGIPDGIPIAARGPSSSPPGVAAENAAAAAANAAAAHAAAVNAAAAVGPAFPGLHPGEMIPGAAFFDAFLPEELALPTLFLGAPSKGYTDELVEQDWQDVQDYLSGRAVWGGFATSPEGFITDAAPDAISLIRTYLNEKWKLAPHVRIVFCGVVSDSGNVWEFADGSVVPFSQFANAVESRPTPVILDVISGTPNAADWGEKIKAFNAKNAPTKIVNLYVPASPDSSRPASALGVATGTTQQQQQQHQQYSSPRAASAAPASSTLNESLAKSSTIQSLAAKSPASRMTSVAADSPTKLSTAKSSQQDVSSPAAASPSMAATPMIKQESVVDSEEDDVSKAKLENDVLVEDAKMQKILDGIRSTLKLRGERSKMRAEKYEAGRKNKYWYDWPYSSHPDWRSLPYHPTYDNAFYPWTKRPGAFKNITPFAEKDGWTTK